MLVAKPGALPPMAKLRIRPRPTNRCRPHTRLALQPFSLPSATTLALRAGWRFVAEQATGAAYSSSERPVTALCKFPEELISGPTCAACTIGSICLGCDEKPEQYLTHSTTSLPGASWRDCICVPGFTKDSYSSECTPRPSSAFKTYPRTRMRQYVRPTFHDRAGRVEPRRLLLPD